MEPLTPIPTPASKRLEEFRVRIMPALVLAVCMITVVILWRQSVAPSSFTAEVEKIESSVISPDAGIITNLLVQRFQAVKAGEIVAEVISTDPRRIGARMDMLRGEMAASQMEVNSLVEREKIGFDYQRLKSDLQKDQMELAEAKATLAPADRDMEIAKGLVAQKIITEQELNYFSKIREPLKTRVEELTRIVGELAEQVNARESLSKMASPAATAVALQGNLKRFESEREKVISDQATPIVLRAPIDGVVTAILHQSGENILAGEALITITAKESKRIIGYLHQPASETPKPGAPVTIRSRTSARLEADSHIAAVSGHFEVITNFSLARVGVLHDTGMPLSIDIPEKLRPLLHPGELVEVSFKH